MNTPAPSAFSLARFFIPCWVAASCVGFLTYSAVLWLITTSGAVFSTPIYWIELSFWYFVGMATAISTDAFFVVRFRRSILGNPISLFSITTTIVFVVIVCQYFLDELSPLFDLIAMGMGEPGNRLFGAITSFVTACSTLPLIFFIYNKVFWRYAAKPFGVARPGQS